MAKLNFGIICLFVFLTYQQTALAEYLFEQNVDKFHSSLYAELAKSSSLKNLVFSPFCTQMCLGMIRMAAKDATAIEIDEVAKFSWGDSNEIAQAFKDVLNDNSENIQVANKFYIQKNLTPNPNFINILTDKFNTNLECIDTTDGTTAANNINKWVNSKTDKNLKGAVDKQIFNADFDVLVMNYIFFGGTWGSPFNTDDTTIKQFTLSSGQITNVPMMWQENTFQYAQLNHLKAQALSMDFIGDLSMLILLPNENSNLNNLVSKMRDTPITNITSSLESTTVTLTLPKFKVEVQGDLVPVLKNMGLQRIFADNSQLNDLLANKNQVKITNILHKAFIKIDEKGAEGHFNETNIGVDPYQKDAVFTANRPFYFIIRNIANLVIFAGHIVNP